MSYIALQGNYGTPWHDRSALSLEDLLEMATLGGAQALGMGDHIGSLEVGKRADIVIANPSDWDLQPVYDAMFTASRGLTGSDVETVIVDGKVVVANGVVTTIDEAELRAHLRNAGPRSWPTSSRSRTEVPDRMDTHLRTATTEAYKAKTPVSRGYLEQFCRHLPGGETRSVTHYDPYPVVLAEGHGAFFCDVDGNEYIDVLNNYTSLVHGHGLRTHYRGGTGRRRLAPCSRLRTGAVSDLASMLTERYPAVEKVRFTNSGTEASLLATRIVRAATGRRRVVIFTGGYHGSVPEFLDNGGDTTSVIYNDFDGAFRAIDSSVAAVFVEPFLGSGGVIPAEDGFLRSIEARAHAVGSLFVLDEVQSLRNAFHGTHSELGLEPDLIVMGKIIGGGLPVGALGGKASLMNLTSARDGGSLSHSGTFNGNVVTMRAGAASLGALDEPAIRR